SGRPTPGRTSPGHSAPPGAATLERSGLRGANACADRIGEPPRERSRRSPPAPIPPRFTPPLSTPSPMDHELSPVWTRPGGDGDSADITGERTRRPDARMEPPRGVETPWTGH